MGADVLVHVTYNKRNIYQTVSWQPLNIFLLGLGGAGGAGKELFFTATNKKIVLC